MPLFTHYRPEAGALVALWTINEDEATLRADLPLAPAETAELATITHPAQRVEWLACRAVLCHVVNRHYVPAGAATTYRGLWKDEWGKPHLRDLPHYVSLSHTTGWAAVAVHATRPIGLDIEPLRSQLVRVVPRVLSEAEIAHAAGRLPQLARYWCAKEALYKLYGKRQLAFREHLFIEPFADDATELTGHVRLPDHAATLRIRCWATGPGLVAVAY